MEKVFKRKKKKKKKKEKFKQTLMLETDWSRLENTSHHCFRFTMGLILAWIFFFIWSGKSMGNVWNFVTQSVGILSYFCRVFREGLVPLIKGICCAPLESLLVFGPYLSSSSHLWLLISMPRWPHHGKPL